MLTEKLMPTTQQGKVRRVSTAYCRSTLSDNLLTAMQATCGHAAWPAAATDAMLHCITADRYVPVSMTWKADAFCTEQAAGKAIDMPYRRLTCVSHSAGATAALKAIP